MNIKITLQFVTALAFWFLVFWFIAYVSEWEFMILGKYWLTAIVLAFFVGCHTGIHMLKKIVMK